MTDARDRRLGFVGISGNISRPSRTRTMIELVLECITTRGLGTTGLFDLVELSPALGALTSRIGAPQQVERAWNAVERCDVLVVATPVYKASYGGLFKHFLDLIDKDTLRGRPVVACATARLPEYSFVLERHLRPLLLFFGMDILSDDLFLTDLDFGHDGQLMPGAVDQVERTADALHIALVERGLLGVARDQAAWPNAGQS